jgi:hypothetical protein
MTMVVDIQISRNRFWAYSKSQLPRRYSLRDGQLRSRKRPAGYSVPERGQEDTVVVEKAVRCRSRCLYWLTFALATKLRSKRWSGLWFPTPRISVSLLRHFCCDIFHMTEVQLGTLKEILYPVQDIVQPNKIKAATR